MCRNGMILIVCMRTCMASSLCAQGWCIFIEVPEPLIWLQVLRIVPGVWRG